MSNANPFNSRTFDASSAHPDEMSDAQYVEAVFVALTAYVDTLLKRDIWDEPKPFTLVAIEREADLRRLIGPRLLDLARKHHLPNSQGTGQYWCTDFQSQLSVVRSLEPVAMETLIAAMMERHSQLHTLFSVVNGPHSPVPQFATPAPGPPATTHERAKDAEGLRRPKRSTQQGEARAKIIAALNKHHQYETGSVLNSAPVGVNELGRLAGVSSSTVSHFLHVEFCRGREDAKPHQMYKRACLTDGVLAQSLRLLNGDVRPSALLNHDPADRRTRRAGDLD